MLLRRLKPAHTVFGLVRNPNMKIREKKHRLHKNLYKGKTTVVITACIKDRVPAFTSEEIVSVVKKFLVEASSRFVCDVDAFCFMPDHLHLILSGKKRESSCLDAVRLFKQRSGYWFSQKGFSWRWQKDFYDHILREDEDLIKQIRYIMENPLRKGIVRNWKHYPFSWSKYRLD